MLNSNWSSRKNICLGNKMDIKTVALFLAFKQLVTIIAHKNEITSEALASQLKPLKS